MIALLLAGGRGARMWPAAETRNKTTLPVGNVPAVRRLADDLLACGIQGLVVGTGVHGASVRNALQGIEPSLVRFVDTSRDNGSAEAVLHMLRESGETGDFLVVYGDTVLPGDQISRVIAQHKASLAAATVLVAPMGDEDCREWIGATVQDDVLTSVEGHPREANHRLGGVFAFAPSAVPYLSCNPGVFRHVPVGGMPPVESDLGESLAQMCDDRLPVAAVVADGFLVDMDKPWHVLQANALWTRWRLSTAAESVIPATCRIDDSAEIDGPLLLGDNVVIGKRVVIRGGLIAGAGTTVVNGPILSGGVALGAHVQVRDYCTIEGGSVCGDRGVYAHGSEFSGTALDNVYLYHYCEIYGLLGSSVDIGAATVCGTLRFDDREAFHRVQGRKEIPAYAANASYIGDYARTGVNAILMPGCKVGAWSCVGPGVVLGEDLPNRKAVFVRQQLEMRDWGPEKYGW